MSDAAQEPPDAPQTTILVADDFETTRHLLLACLRMLGYRVIEATNGQEAVEIAQRERPDLILMNVNMPILDGLTAIRRIREIKEMRYVPVVAPLARACFITRPRLPQGVTSISPSRLISINYRTS
jgi:CheY-like chemotaxis protein